VEKVEKCWSGCVSPPPLVVGKVVEKRDNFYSPPPHALKGEEGKGEKKVYPQLSTSYPQRFGDNQVTPI
jgi:hypothetical protein